jgi:hypothetical protein
MFSYRIKFGWYSCYEKNRHVSLALTDWNPEDQEFWNKAGKRIAALYGCIVFYVSCIAITWWNYVRKEASMPC